MIAATRPEHRPADARLLVVDAAGTITHLARAALPQLLRPGDLLVANDAATLPASLSGTHDRSGRAVEVRLAGRESLSPGDVHRFRAVVFGDGDFRQRTEDRPSPPPLAPGDGLTLGPLRAVVAGLLDHPRLVSLVFQGSAAEIWRGLARHGRPIQYSHVPDPLAVWDTWTAIAGPPAAFEPPSAGFLLSWQLLARLHAAGVRTATLTHAAGLSSTGDPRLDRRLPFDEPYDIPFRTAALVRDTRQRGSRVVALGTTVVRALEHAAAADGRVRSGTGTATQTIGPDTTVQAVQAVITGTHEPGTSHHELLRAFIDDEVLARVDVALDAGRYRTHEFGDSMFVEATGRRPAAPR